MLLNIKGILNVIGCCILLFVQIQTASATPSIDNKAIEIIKEIFSKPDTEIDLATTKLTFDKLVDPSIDVTTLLAEINKTVETIENGLATKMKPLDKLFSLSAYLYESGYWNEFQPFQYNFEDPFAQILSSKLISNKIN